MSEKFDFSKTEVTNIVLIALFVAFLAFAFLFKPVQIIQQPAVEQRTDVGVLQGPFQSYNLLNFNVTNNSNYTNTSVSITGCLRLIEINSTYPNYVAQNVTVEIWDKNKTVIFTQAVGNGTLFFNRSIGKFLVEDVIVGVRNGSGGANASSGNGTKTTVDLVWQPIQWC